MEGPDAAHPLALVLRSLDHGFYTAVMLWLIQGGGYVPKGKNLRLAQEKEISGPPSPLSGRKPPPHRRMRRIRDGFPANRTVGNDRWFHFFVPVGSIAVQALYPLHRKGYRLF